MAHADWIIDLGPGAGHDGGRVVFEGTPADARRRTLDPDRGSTSPPTSAPDRPRSAAAAAVAAAVAAVPRSGARQPRREVARNHGRRLEPRMSVVRAHVRCAVTPRAAQTPPASDGRLGDGRGASLPSGGGAHVGSRRDGRAPVWTSRPRTTGRDARRGARTGRNAAGNTVSRRARSWPSPRGATWRGTASVGSNHGSPWFEPTLVVRRRRAPRAPAGPGGSVPDAGRASRPSAVTGGRTSRPSPGPRA